MVLKGFLSRFVIQYVRMLQSTSPLSQSFPLSLLMALLPVYSPSTSLYPVCQLVCVASASVCACISFSFAIYFWPHFNQLIPLFQDGGGWRWWGCTEWLGWPQWTCSGRPGVKVRITPECWETKWKQVQRYIRNRKRQAIKIVMIRLTSLVPFVYFALLYVLSVVAGAVYGIYNCSFSGVAQISHT